jgi:hypothetical protein
MDYLVDKITFELCPSRGDVMCTITDPNHRHVFSHMISGRPPVEIVPSQDEDDGHWYG